MASMQTEPIDRLIGEGWLTREGSDEIVLGNVSYTICVGQHMVPVGGEYEVLGVKRIVGTITPPGKISMADLIGKPVVLHMQDGRTLKLVVANDVGQITNTGGFDPPLPDG